MGNQEFPQKVLFSKICPSAGAHGAQKSCKSTALTQLDKRHDHFGKDAACAIAGLATLLPVVMLLLSSRPSRWSRARRALPLAAAAGPPIFWVFAPIRVPVAAGANPCHDCRKKGRRRKADVNSAEDPGTIRTAGLSQWQRCNCMITNKRTTTPGYVSYRRGHSHIDKKHTSAR